MFKKIACVVAMWISSTAMGGIIGVGGTNANQHPELLAALRKANGIGVNDSDFRRLSVRIGTTGVINAEVKTPEGKSLRRDFIKIYANGEGEIVDKAIRIKLDPQGPGGSQIVEYGPARVWK